MANENATKTPVAVLISGRGSNMQALAAKTSDPDYPAKVVLVISDRADAGGLAVAAKMGIETDCIERATYPTRREFESALDARLRASGAKILCLAGYMRLLTARFVEAWGDNILNIHPSLLPAFKGLDTHERAIKAGVRLTGCTVHIVRPAMDDGPIIAQSAVPVLPDDTPDTLATRILAAEHVLYPMALALMAEGRVELNGTPETGERCDISDASWPITTLTSPIPG